MARKILMIDDDRLQHRLIQAHFRHFRVEPYELDWAGTYEEGLERLMSGGYAACLLDFQLGGRDGLQLIREAVGRGCRTPIIFLTAESSQTVDIEAMNAGALDYLVKGEIAPASLERSIRYALKLGETLDALHRLATRDELTGLVNRREFDRLLDAEWTRARSFGHRLALAMVDIDHFKLVNDRRGHPAGDAVLREVARRLRGAVRPVDIVARFGGEEFALVLIEAGPDGARRAALAACEAVRGHAVESGEGPPLELTVSAGWAVAPENAASASELVAAADRALYAAKGQGRNRVAGPGGAQA